MTSRRRPLAVLAVMAALAFGLAIGFMAGSASAGSPQPAWVRIVTVTPATLPGYSPAATPVPTVNGNG